MRRIIIMIFAVIATMLSFNQKANAQKQVKVPVFEGIITAKKGTVNIRKEASAQSEKIGTLEADIIFYPILDQTDGWYRILVPDIDEESTNIERKVTCGYVAKTFCKKVMEEDYPTSPSQIVNYLENKLHCKNSFRKHGKYKQNIIVSGTFAYHYNEAGFCIGRDDGRFIGVAHKGVMVGKYVNEWLLPSDYYDVREKKYGNMSFLSDGNELTDQQIENALQYSQKAILYATPSYDEDNNYSDVDDYMGIGIMYVDMDKYPFKYDTIQFNDDESFSYFVVEDEEEASNNNTQDLGLEDKINKNQATIERAEQALKDMEKIQKELYPEPEVTTNTPHLSARLLNVENRGGTLLIDLAVKSDRDKNKLAFSFGTYTEEEGKMDAIKGYSVLIGNKKPAKNEETLVRISIKGKGSLHSLYRAMALLDYNGGKAMINVYNITW